MFLDCDDVYLDNKIKKSYEVIKNYEPRASLKSINVVAQPDKNA